MEKDRKESQKIKFIRELCKEKSDSEIEEAEDRFLKLLLVIKRMCDRLERSEIDDGLEEIVD